MNKRWVSVWGFLIAACLLVGSISLAFSLQSYPSARAWGDRISKDGSLEMLTPERFAALQRPLLAAGLVLLAAAVFLVVFRMKVVAGLAAGWAGLVRDWARLKSDGRLLWADCCKIKLSKREALGLLGVTLAAAAARVAFLWRPLEHDEAYTVVTFASSTLRQVLTDYHLPNNHIFHTLQVHWAFGLFGYQTWAVRLPAIMAGVMAIPVLYLVGRRFYQRPVAFLAAGLAAVLPVLVYYATNARGYALLMLLALLELGLAVYLLQHNNLAGWVIFVILGALGMWTVPVFVYPLGMVAAWLTASALTGESREAYGGWIRLWRSLLLAGLAVGVLTLLLYSPVFWLGSGFRSVFANDTIAPLVSGDFLPTVRSRMEDTWNQWNMGLSVPLGWLGGVGILLSLVLHPVWAKKSGLRVPVLAAGVGWVALLLLVQRPNPWPKLWAFAIPLAVMWAAAGWVGLVELALGRTAARTNLTAGLVCGILLAAWAVTAWQTVHRPEANPYYQSGVEQVAVYLKDHLTERDLVVVSPPNDAVLWYYARVYQIDMDHFKRELPFFRALVLVDPSLGQDVHSVMEARGPDLIFFDLSTAKQVFQVGTVQLFELVPDLNMIRKEYHLEP